VIRNTARMVAGDHDHNIVFTSALRLKDVEYAVRFARAVGAGSPFGALAEGIYPSAVRYGVRRAQRKQSHRCVPYAGVVIGEMAAGSIA